MNNEEREFITQFISRVSGAVPQRGSVPSSPMLPPIDPEADNFIKEKFQKFPEASYRITQLAVVQEAALAEAQGRIRQLEWELHQAHQNRETASSGQGGFFSSLFGNGKSQQSQAIPQHQSYNTYGMGGPYSQGQDQGQYNSSTRQAQYNTAGAPAGNQQYSSYSGGQRGAYPPGYRPGLFHGGGSGFLGSALTTAAGVAGGMMVGNALMGLFGRNSPMSDSVTGFMGGEASSVENGVDPFAADGGALVDPEFNADNGSIFDDNVFDNGGDWGGWDDNGF